MSVEILNELKLLNSDREEYIKFIEECKDWDRLLESRLFKKLVLDEYCEKESLRLVSLISAVQEDQKDKVFSALEAISHFKSFLNIKQQSAEVAKTRLAETEANIKELEEELNNPKESVEA